MTSKERQTTETVQAKKDKQQKHKSWLLQLVETIGTEELGPSSPPPIYTFIMTTVVKAHIKLALEIRFLRLQ